MIVSRSEKRGFHPSTLRARSLEPTSTGASPGLRAANSTGIVRPVIDRRENVTLCTMSGVGFGLSPASGHAIRDLVLDGQCSFTDLHHLRLDRFGELEPEWRENRGWMPL